MVDVFTFKDGKILVKMHSVKIAPCKQPLGSLPMNQSVQQLTSLDKIVDPISEPIHRGFKTYNAKFDPLTE